MLGISANASSISQQVRFNCPSGECTFPPVTSLAVCSRCEDITSRLEKNHDSTGDLYFDLIRDRSFASRQPNCTEYRLPNGLFLNNFNASGGDKDMVYMSMMGTTYRQKTVSMADIDTLFWAQSMIRVDEEDFTKPWNETTVRAEECALYYCVKKYTSEVHNATLFEEWTRLEEETRRGNSWTLDESEWENVDNMVVDALAYHPVESAIERTDLQLGREGSQQAYNISQDAVDGISAFMQKTFAVCIAGANCTTEALEDWGPVNGFYIGNNLATNDSSEQFEPSIAKAIWTTKSLDTTFSNIASSMSNAIRNGADGDNSTITGSVGVFEAVYVVDWRWIALHCFVVVGTLLFLTSTIYATLNEDGEKIPVWKGSELAVLSRGYVVGEYLRDARTIHELQEKARGLSVALVDQRHGEYVQENQNTAFISEPPKQGMWSARVDPSD
ncbi:hypothetical protein jhhlp_004946 [Lomentospora prolificans]|uniref:Uncharacterized protein n=1 Tax=Lomentospora prolificans TaxID=41688 RepID=A0A2N3N7Y9_9PEZI|nr:hypothetical protein jhhlp_004946 [Lomentospora prolificans]